MKNLIFSTIVALTLFGCTGVKVTTAFDPKIDFSQYQSFCWLQGCDVKYQGPDYGYDPSMFINVQQAIKEELESKGLVNDENSPDLIIGFHVIMEEQQSVIANSPEMLDPYHQEIRYWDEYDDYYTQEVYRFLEGSLVIDFIDAKKGNVIWQSNARRYMELIPDLDKEDIRKGVAKALKKYPPEN